MSKEKIMTVGFTSEVAQQIKALINKANPMLEVETESYNSLEEEIDVTLHYEYDIIILNSIGFKIPLLEVITDIKNTFPLTEIIVVSFSKNYDLAINSFRAGARDILEYPLNDKKLGLAIQRSLRYRQLYYRSESFGNVTALLNIFGDFRNFRQHDDLFIKTNDYLTNNYSSEPFMVFTLPTIPTDEQGKPVVACLRRHWAKSGHEDKYVKSTLTKLFESIEKKLFDESFSYLSNYQIDDEIYEVIRLGSTKNQLYIGLFKIHSKHQRLHYQAISGHFIKLIQSCFRQLLQNEIEAELTTLAHIDDVTGLYNQRRLYMDLDRNIARWDETKEGFGIIFIDIDHFKNVNDSHGHLVGSVILVELANTLRKVLRESDLIYRYGGDEFIIIVSDLMNDSTICKQIGSRVLNAIKKKKFHANSAEEFKLTVSIGIAEFPKDAKNKKDIIDIADNMMYVAKQKGRDRVCTTDEILKSKAAQG